VGGLRDVVDYYIKLYGRKKEYCNPVSECNAPSFEMIRETAGVNGKLAERVPFRFALRKLDPDSDIIRRVPVDALMGDVESVFRAIKEDPPLTPLEFFLRFLVTSIFQKHHRPPFALKRRITKPSARML
jgi:hypothetical protein